MFGFVGNAQDINQLGKDADFIKYIKMSIILFLKQKIKRLFQI